MNQHAIECLIPAPADATERCEECGQEITHTSSLNPAQYAAFLRFLCLWLRLPERSRDIIAKMIVTPGLTPPEYCPEVSTAHAYRLVSEAQRHMREIVQREKA
jgi:hypothetical protein